MAIIVNRTNGSDVDKVISLANEQMARTLTVGSDWKRIRIGIRYEISSSYASISNPLFAWGIGAGTSSLYNSNTTTYFLGYDNDISKTWSNATNQYSTDDISSSRFIQKINNSITVFHYDRTYFDSVASNGKHRRILYMDMKKDIVDPGMWLINYSFDAYNGWGSGADYSSSIFYSDITNDTSSVSDQHSNPKTFYVPVSESVYGTLDTLIFYWNKTNPPIEISDVAVYRFA